MLFIDFSKAFDSISHNFLWKALSSQGVSKKVISILRELYKDATAYVKTDTKGKQFKIEKGVRQGDPLSPNLFNCALEEAMRQLNWNNKGLRINGEYLNNLRFADDLVLISDNLNELVEMAEEFIEVCQPAGLTVNTNKTKILSNAKKEPIWIAGNQINWESEVKYLGQTVSFSDTREKVLSSRIKNGWSSYWRLKEIFKGKTQLSTKVETWRACIQPVISYGAQTWALPKSSLERLSKTQRAMERSILDIKRKDKIRASVIRTKTNLTDLAEVVTKNKWKYAGHLWRREGERWENKVEGWTPYDRKRGVGRPLTRWRDEFKKALGPEWRRYTHDRKKWRDEGEANARRWAVLSKMERMESRGASVRSAERAEGPTLLL